MRKFQFIFIALSIVLLGSCERQNLDNLKDVLYIQREGAKMPAYIYGNAREKVFVVLLHGGPGGSGMTYRPGPLKDILEDKYAMVYWDQRGQGMSQGTYSKDKVSISNMVEDLKMLIDVIRHKYGEESKVFIMGHSWGGTLGTAFMVDESNQKMVSGWIEVDGAHDHNTLYKEAIKLFEVQSKKQLKLGNNIEFWQEVQDEVRKIDTNNISNDNRYYLNSNAFKAESNLSDDGILNEYSGDPGDALAHYFVYNNYITDYVAGTITNLTLADENEKTDYTDQLHKIRIPTLLLWGEYDFVVPRKLGDMAYERISSEDLEYVIFYKSGHSPMATEPEAFANEVIEFIDRNSSN